jgi:putative nucleotidyltransferase with HDIG domain
MLAIVVGATIALVAALLFTVARTRLKNRPDLGATRSAPPSHRVGRTTSGADAAARPAVSPPGPPKNKEASPSCRRFLDSVKELDAIPGVASRLLQMLDDPKSSVDFIKQEICRDQGLMALILRMANSAFYGARGQVRDITESIVVLGFDTTRQLVLGRLSRQVLRKNDRWQKALWRHALATGLAAQACAREVRGVTVAHAFTGGLLHDIGKAVLHEASAEQVVFAWSAVAGSDKPSDEVEREQLGTDHNEVGAELLKKWEFPSVYQSVAREHGSLGDASRAPEKERRVLSIVTLAGAVASWMGYDAVPDRTGPDPHEHPAMVRLNAFPSVIESMKTHVEKELLGLAEVLG